MLCYALGGITSTNALSYLEAGASHIIVTSYVFQDGVIQFDRLDELVAIVGKNKLVLDLSCRRKPDSTDGLYYVVTNKWTKFTDYPLTYDLNLNYLFVFLAILTVTRLILPSLSRKS